MFLTRHFPCPLTVTFTLLLEESQRQPEHQIKDELAQKGYTPLHVIRLKCNGGVRMPLVVVILPKTEKSQQVFNEN
ncbi:unnamed protein product [Acanthoscelides obtectus]|nr:unnamed protein product [Acanthoscelides obtectus]CAH2010850.1 unnamed protein product [Acanthoscelides obtectus]CAK1635299.1 hypothetical protein AOBTE_LOCUS9185 [Acanthoscelides obtectus]CAK1635302.1 hypothetical protein AOBTE_LOCUS9188 [Acanthoscelides obtectus]